MLAAEPDQDKDDFRELLQGMLDPQLHIAPAIRAKIEEGDFEILFLTGIGEVFPYIRSHNVLNNLQSVVTEKPMLMFFPGRYEQSDTPVDLRSVMTSPSPVVLSWTKPYMPGTDTAVVAASPTSTSQPNMSAC